MKIGIFSDRYLPQTDGISVSIETFRIELEKLGHEVYVFAPKPSLRYAERSEHIIRFPAIKGLFFEDNLTSFFFPPQVMRQIDKLELDIIHYQTPGQIGLMGLYYALQKKIPLVTTYHTDFYEYAKHYPQSLPGVIALSLLIPLLTKSNLDEFRQAITSIKPERNLDTWNQKMIVRTLTVAHNHCNLVITPSVKFEKQLKSWKTTAKIVTLPTGVNKIPSTERAIGLVKKKYNLSPSDQLILLVCRIGTEKNIGLLIHAFDIIGQQIPNAKLMIIGPGSDLDYFKDMAASTNYPERIVFTDYVPYKDLGAYYDIATLFAFPSLADTQGLAVNEAACASLPIVMVDKQIAQVVVNGENGYYSRNTTKDFAAKIITILTHTKLREKMAKRSAELATEVTAHKQAAKLLKLYEMVISNYQK